MRRVGLLVGIGLLVALPSGLLGAKKYRSVGRCGPAPPAKPHRRKAAEGFAPLPLPVVPLRRTEKKRPPRAPILIGKIRYGRGQDWLNDPGDIPQLMSQVRRTLGLWYGWRVENLAEITRRHQAGLRNKLPLLFMSGHEAFSFSETERKALRQYMVDGGTLLVSACCGMKPFVASARREIRKLLPEREMTLLPTDHPIYNSYYKIGQVEYMQASSSPLDQGAGKKELPHLYGVHLGVRLALVFSDFDLCCGWDRHTHPYGQRVEPSDAVRLGTNLVAYVCANHRLGKYLAKTTTLEGPHVRPRQQFVFAQVRHNGDWNPMPSALAGLLKELANNTSASVKFERKAIDLDDTNLFQYPFVYMTGMRNPRLSAKEVSNLRQYLKGGGFLLADATYGLREFDTAFRAMVKELFPQAKLEKLDRRDPVFSSFYKIPTLVTTIDGSERPAELEGLYVDGNLTVVYSQYDLGCGWARVSCPYRKGIATEDALRLATNVIVNAMQN